MAVRMNGAFHTVRAAANITRARARLQCLGEANPGSNARAAFALDTAIDVFPHRNLVQQVHRSSLHLDQAFTLKWAE